MQEVSTQPYLSEYKLLRLIVRSILGLSIMIVFVHLNPLMPEAGLDYSWMMGMNESIAQKLTFGKDVIFPSGPYGSVYTRLYHPATDYLMITGGLILGLINTYLILNLAKHKTIIWHVLFTCLLSAGLFLQDSPLFLYPLCLILFIYRKIVALEKSGTYDINSQFSTSLAFAPIGLLILIKGSVLIMCLIIIMASVFVFWRLKMKRLAFAVVIFPMLTSLILLGIAGQPLATIWYYCTSMVQITSGYSGAMFLNGSKTELLLYILSCGMILYYCFTVKEISKQAKYYLLFLLAFYFFTSFKAGFTRHDGHAMIAAGCLLTAVMLAYTILNQKKLYLALLFSAFTYTYITYQYVGSSTLNMFRPIPSLYVESLDGLMMRISNKNALKQIYLGKLEALKNNTLKIPPMNGTTDIYSYDQSLLLASGNKWSPRPILQSYSAYTEKLAGLNEDHLTGTRAPDNIIFTVQTIDGRFPSLDDGISWPTIVNNYTPVSTASGYAFLIKKRKNPVEPLKEEVKSGKYALNENILLPDSSQAIFVKLDIQETFAGKLITSFYQPEPLDIVVTLLDGTEHKYRIIPEMGKSGFILSPLVENTNDFLALFNQHFPDSTRNKIVKSFRVSNDGMGFRKKVKSWKNNYKVRFYKINYTDKRELMN